MISSTQMVATNRDRESWMDNVRVVVLIGVIILHTATGYVLDFVGWYYDDERDASSALSDVMTVPGLLGGLFWLGPLFLVSGWLSARSLARRGPGDFVRARLVRLGLPLLVFTIAVQPLTDFIGNVRSERGTFAYYFDHTETASMWFVAALLVFSIAYATVRRLHPISQAHGLSPKLTILLGMATIAATSFALWQVTPPTAEAPFNLRFAEWPQGGVLFALGVVAAEANWFGKLPTHYPVRWLGWAALAGFVAFAALLAIGLSAGVDDLGRGASWPNVAAAFLNGIIAVAYSIWFVVWLKRRWPDHGALVARMARASYSTYFLHPLVITSLMVLASPITLGAWPKFALIAAAAVPACFVVGFALTRLPWMSRVF